MKKLRRKQSWRDVDPEARYCFGRKPTPTHEHRSNVFCRLNNRHRICNATHLAAAGYPMAVLTRLDLWQETHEWCAETFRNAKGKTYTWTGEKFWFQTDADRLKFVQRWCPPVSLALRADAR